MENTAILEAGNESIRRGDHEGFLAHCAEDTKWTFVGDRVLEGKAAVRAWMAETYKQPPTFHVDGMIADGDFVVAYGTITMDGTAHAYADIWRFRDGKIVGLRALVIPKGATPVAW